MGLVEAWRVPGGTTKYSEYLMAHRFPGTLRSGDTGDTGDSYTVLVCTPCKKLMFTHRGLRGALMCGGTKAVFRNTFLSHHDHFQKATEMSS